MNQFDIHACRPPCWPFLWRWALEGWAQEMNRNWRKRDGGLSGANNAAPPPSCVPRIAVEIGCLPWLFQQLPDLVPAWDWIHFVVWNECEQRERVVHLLSRGWTEIDRHRKYNRSMLLLVPKARDNPHSPDMSNGCNVIRSERTNDACACHNFFKAFEPRSWQWRGATSARNDDN